jgi:rSAM/selenodomain-associated transferase 2
VEITVIIPTMNEEPTIVDCLGAVGSDPRVEVIVSDGHSTDATTTLALQEGARVVTGLKGRGPQLNRGAAAASTPNLIFVHADCRLPEGWFDAVRRALEDPSTSLACFHLRTEPTGGAPATGLIHRMGLGVLDLRSRGRRLPYGDQGFAVRRATFDQIGGFPQVPLMEDVVFAQACRRLGTIRRLPLEMRTSARRFERLGISIRLKMTVFPLLFRLGVPPEVLVRWYGEAR